MHHSGSTTDKNLSTPLKSILKKPGSSGGPVGNSKQANIVEPERSVSLAKGVTFHLGSFTRTNTSSISSTVTSLSNRAKKIASALRRRQFADLREAPPSPKPTKQSKKSGKARDNPRRKSPQPPPQYRPTPQTYNQDIYFQRPGYYAVWNPHTQQEVQYFHQQRPSQLPEKSTKGRDVKNISKKRKPKKFEDPQSPFTSTLFAKKSALTKMNPAKRKAGPVSAGFMIFYIILLLVSILASILHVLNEARLAHTRSLMLPFSSGYFAVSCEPDDSNNNLLIHIDCPLRDLATFYPPDEFQWSVDPYKGVFFEMKIEMFQWVLTSGGFGVSFEGGWKTNLVDSNEFPFLFYNSHINPDFFPSISGNGRQFATGAKAGGFEIPQSAIMGFSEKKLLPLREDGFYSPPRERPPPVVDFSNTKVFEDALYTGDPYNPKVGDIRITFWGATASHVSAIAKQRKSGFSSYELEDSMDSALRRETSAEAYSSDPSERAKQLLSHLQNVTFPERETALIREGDFSPDQLLEEAIQERDGSRVIIWTTRLLTFALLYLFTLLSYYLANRDMKYINIGEMFGTSMLFNCAMYFVLTGAVWACYFFLIGIPLLLLSITSFVITVFIWSRKSAKIREGDYPPGVAAPLAPRNRSSAPQQTELPHYYHPV